ncbi:39kDa subunit of Ndufa9, NADH ubiquinone oxidoreductase [Pisolithus albus]|nr:39kDa subunit of Ndufa9, NADH ubiquinone oxidoreductase [Pisolithus albus]
MLAKPQLLRVQRSAVIQSKRALHDLSVSYGPPGYSAVSGHVVTGLWLHRVSRKIPRVEARCANQPYLNSSDSLRLSVTARMGTQVIVPYRDEDEKRLLKPMGDLGQIVSMEWDIRNEDQIAECLRHSDIVYNLVGRDYETKNFKFADRLAKVAADHGVQRFVHVSHLNASPTSSSQFYRTKAEGEERVRSVFPNATVVRPAAMFGYEDKFLNNMANWPIWWKLNFGETKIRPVHVIDVAQALANLMSIPQLTRTVTLTYEYLLELVETLTYRAPSRAPVVPKPIALAVARAAQLAWWPLISPDEVERRYIDDVDVPGDWEAVGVRPDEVENHAITYLRRYRLAKDYLRPVLFPARPS